MLVITLFIYTLKKNTAIWICSCFDINAFHLTSTPRRFSYNNNERSGNFCKQKPVLSCIFCPS